MTRIVTQAVAIALAAGALALSARVLMPAASAEATVTALPAPVVDVAPAESGLRTAIFAGGCFWGVQAVFQHVTGVVEAVSGYAGGTVPFPTYEQVSSGNTGHAEAVRVTYDPTRVSYGKLLQLFFSVALDPTEVNRQGPDFGTQYRSELFVDGPEQQRVALAYVKQIDAAHAFAAPIATRIDKSVPFYPAEAYHQDYLLLHPDSLYIAVNDMPKVRHLQAAFPESWQGTPVTVGKLASKN